MRRKSLSYNAELFFRVSALNSPSLLETRGSTPGAPETRNFGKTRAIPPSRVGPRTLLGHTGIPHTSNTPSSDGPRGNGTSRHEEDRTPGHICGIEPHGIQENSSRRVPFESPDASACQSRCSSKTSRGFLRPARLVVELRKVSGKSCPGSRTSAHGRLIGTSSDGRRITT